MIIGGNSATLRAPREDDALLASSIVAPFEQTLDSNTSLPDLPVSIVAIASSVFARVKRKTHRLIVDLVSSLTITHAPAFGCKYSDGRSQSPASIETR